METWLGIVLLLSLLTAYLGGVARSQVISAAT